MRRAFFFFTILLFAIALGSPLRFAYAAAPQTNPASAAISATHSALQTTLTAVHAAISAAATSLSHLASQAFHQTAAAFSSWVKLANRDITGAPNKLAVSPTAPQPLTSPQANAPPPIPQSLSALPMLHLAAAVQGASSGSLNNSPTTLSQNVKQPPTTPAISSKIRQLTSALATSYITQDQLTASLSELNNSLRSLIYQNESVPNSLPASGGYTNNIALSNRIDQLTGTSLSNITVNGVLGITDADIPDGITASNYLPITGGILSGDFTFGNATSTNFFATTASSTNLFATSAHFGVLSLGTSRSRTHLPSRTAAPAGAISLLARSFLEMAHPPLLRVRRSIGTARIRGSALVLRRRPRTFLFTVRQVVIHSEHERSHRTLRLGPVTTMSVSDSLKIKELMRMPQGKYPPAEPGALGIGPLEAAIGVADAAPFIGPPKGGDQRHRLS
jgi:hypothetical protein